MTEVTESTGRDQHGDTGTRSFLIKGMRCAATPRSVVRVPAPKKQFRASASPCWSRAVTSVPSAPCPPSPPSHRSPLTAPCRALHGIEHLLHGKPVGEVRMKVLTAGMTLQEFGNGGDERVLVADDMP